VAQRLATPAAPFLEEKHKIVGLPIPLLFARWEVLASHGPTRPENTLHGDMVHSSNHDMQQQEGSHQLINVCGHQVGIFLVK